MEECKRKISRRKKYRKAEKGAGTVEYVIVILVAIVIGGGLLTFGNRMSGQITETGDSIGSWFGKATGSGGTGGETTGGGSSDPVDTPDSENGTAFAVYSADDNSLDFYKRAGMPEEGSKFNGKTATVIFKQLSYVEWRNYKDSVTRVTFVDKVNPVSTYSWFMGFTKLEEIDLKKLDTSGTDEMAGMFAGCKSLKTIDVSTFNTSRVKSMDSMFRGCTGLTKLDLKNFNLTNVSSMNSMFSGDSSLRTIIGISDINTSNVNDMFETFAGCTELSADCSSWNVPRVVERSGFNYNASGVILPKGW